MTNFREIKIAVYRLLRINGGYSGNAWLNGEKMPISCTFMEEKIAEEV